jgi:alanyl aminopeptidase
MVPAALAPRYAALVQELYGERARGLGFRPRTDEDADTRLLRPALLELVGNEGGDRELRGEALRLARLWLADRAAVSPELVGPVLRLAARTGGEELFDAYLAAARATSESRERRDLLTALASFPEPALRERALDLVLGGGFDIRESGRLLQVFGRDGESRAQLWRWLTAHYGELAAALPAQTLAFLPELAEDFCSEDDRARVAAFFADKVRQHPGADRVLAQTLEQIQLCAAYRQAQAPSVAAFLETRGPAVEAPAAPLLPLQR